jgi:hypothetical protein
VQLQQGGAHPLAIARKQRWQQQQWWSLQNKNDCSDDPACPSRQKVNKPTGPTTNLQAFPLRSPSFNGHLLSGRGHPANSHQSALMFSGHVCLIVFYDYMLHSCCGCFEAFLVIQ